MAKIICDLPTVNSNGLPFPLILLDHSVTHNNVDTLFSFGLHDSLLSCLPTSMTASFNLFCRFLFEPLPCCFSPMYYSWLIFCFFLYIHSRRNQIIPMASTTIHMLMISLVHGAPAKLGLSVPRISSSFLTLGFCICLPFSLECSSLSFSNSWPLFIFCLI